MTNFILFLIALLVALLLGAQFLPEHWAHVARVGFGILFLSGVLFLWLVHFSISWQAEKKKLEELIAELEAQSQQEESLEAATPATSTTGTGEDGEALEPVFRMDAVTGEMREIRPGRYVPGVVELEIKTDE